MTAAAAAWSDNIELLRNSVKIVVPTRNPAPNVSHNTAGNMKLTGAVIFTALHIVFSFRPCVQKLISQSMSDGISPLVLCLLAGSTYSVLSTMPSDSESSSSLSSVGTYNDPRTHMALF